MADLPPQNAYAPLPGKLEIFQNMFKNFTYATNRPFTIDDARCRKEIDNSAFIMYWLSDVLEYFTYPYVMPWTLYENLISIDRNIYEDEINLDFEFWAGDVVFLSTDDDFIIDDPEKYYIGIWYWDKFISFDVEGFHTKSLEDLLIDYPIFTNMSVFRI